MTDTDITAIYEYLTSIPCIDNTLVPGPAGDPNEATQPVRAGPNRRGGAGQGRQ